MTFDPSGRFAYVIGGEYRGATGSVAVNAVDPGTGALTSAAVNYLPVSSDEAVSLTIVGFN